MTINNEYREKGTKCKKKIVAFRLNLIAKKPAAYATAKKFLACLHNYKITNLSKVNDMNVEINIIRM